MGNSIIISLPKEMETAIECLKQVESAIEQALHQILGKKNDL